MDARTDVLVIGAGFAGIGMGVRLKQAGRHDFVILEKADDLGGTWRDNRYPGCACDVPSYLYSFSFEQNPHWSRMFAPAAEIWDYLRGCVDKYGLAAHIRYGARVTQARFDEGDDSWEVALGDGDRYRSRVLVSGVGALHVPHVPDLPGLDTFEGTAFHTARWDHTLDLTGRRVAVVGTGASSAQVVPQIVPRVRRLDLYQRTAAWVTPKPDRRIGPRERRVYAASPLAQRAVRDLVYWGLEVRGLGFTVHPRAMRFLEAEARRHLERQVPDPELRAKLTPDYQIGCKRIVLADDYYPALAQDNVDVVVDPIAAVTPTGIVDSTGTERPADTIVFGTGFNVSANLSQMTIAGRDGAELSDVWRRQGVAAHLGITITGFPNLFLLLGPNTGLGHTSVVFMIEAQIHYVLKALELMDRTGATSLEVRPEVQQRFADRVRRRLDGTVWQSGCHSWYLDDDGGNHTIWPWSTGRYWWRTRRVRPSHHRLTGNTAFVPRKRDADNSATVARGVWSGPS